MASARRPLLLLLLLFILKEAKSQQGSRLPRQFSGNTNPSFGTDAHPQQQPSSVSVKGCQERPQIPHAKVRCGYSGCRVLCDKDYKIAAGVGFTTLSCDHSSGTLTLDGAPWHEKGVSCLPYCGPDGCLHGGTCVRPGTCECSLGFSGQNCEIAPEIQTEPTPGPQSVADACPDPDFPVQNAQVTREGQNLKVWCNEGHVFKSGRTTASIQCRNGAWDHPEGVFAPGGALVCEAYCGPDGCLHGGHCVRPGTCECSLGFSGQNCEIATEIQTELTSGPQAVETRCDPPCLNGGTCLLEGDCPYKFSGGYCRLQRCVYPVPTALVPASPGQGLDRDLGESLNLVLGGVPSRSPVPLLVLSLLLPDNALPSSLSSSSSSSSSSCSSSSSHRMTVQCRPRHRMLNGRRTETILCRAGEWFLPGLGYLSDNDVTCYPEDSMQVKTLA